MPADPQEDPVGYNRLPGTEPPVPPQPLNGSGPATDDHIRDGVEDQRRVVKDGTISVKARIEERQATEVPAMRYVLGIGVFLAIIGMFLALVFLR
jgi:hypothetical protein